MAGIINKIPLVAASATAVIVVIGAAATAAAATAARVALRVIRRAGCCRIISADVPSLLVAGTDRRNAALPR